MKSYLENDKSFILAVSKEEKVNKDIIRYHDELSENTYDHNYYLVNHEITSDDIKEIFKDTLKRERGFIKIMSNKEEKLLKEAKYEEGIILTMINDNPDSSNWKINKDVEIKVMDDNIYPYLLSVELKYYSHYGVEYVKQSMGRMKKLHDEDSRYKYICVLKDNKLVSYCHTFNSNGYIAIDGLFTIEEERKQYMATTLLKYIYDTYKLPLMLHADIDDTPKEMYKKLGFIDVYKTYEYLLINK